MKYYLTTLGVFCCCVIALGQYAAKGPRTMSVFDESGRLQMSITDNPVCSCKTYTEYYADGRVLAKRTFKVVGRKEVVDGEDIEYYPNGTIKSFRFWKDAILDGRCYYNDDQGRLKREEYYEDGYKAGIWRFFDNDGVLEKQHVYQARQIKWNSKNDNNFPRSNQKSSEVLARSKQSLANPQNRTRNSDLSEKVGGDTAEGASLFRLKCSVCHAQPRLAPGLKGVFERRSTLWLRQKILYGQKMLIAGDSVSKSGAKIYQTVRHPDFANLSEAQVGALVIFLKSLR